MVQVHLVRLAADGGGYEHLALRRSPDRKKHPGLWQAVVGSIDAGETAVQAALREAMEETGLAPDRFWALPMVAAFYWAPDDTVHNDPVFGILVEEHSAVRLSEEHDAYEWLDLEGFQNRVTMPSHKEAARLFEKDILGNLESSRFFELPV